jgi:hypothetical protein
MKECKAVNERRKLTHPERYNNSYELSNIIIFSPPSGLVVTFLRKQSRVPSSSRVWVNRIQDLAGDRFLFWCSASA